MSETPSPRLPEPDRPWMMRTYAGPLGRRALQRAVPAQPREGPDRPVDRLRPADPDRLRPRSRARPRRGRQGRRLDRPRAATCATLLDGIPLDQMNTSMTINATAAWLLALYIVAAEEQGVARGAAPGHDPERHPQGVPQPRHLRVPARPEHAADRRHDRLHRRRTSRGGTRSTSAPTTSRRPARRRSRRSPTR